MGEGEEDIPWPGFVDILSTVLIVFVFFMMMTSVVIFVLSKNHAKEVVEQAQAQVEAAAGIPPAQRVAALKEEVEGLKQENASMRQTLVTLQNKIAQTQTTVVSEKDQIVSEQQGAKSAVVTFNDFGVTLKDETVKQLEALAKARRPEQVTLVAWPPSKTGVYSAVQQNALNRALNIRNVFLQEGMPAQAVRMRLATEGDSPLSQEQETGYGAVQILFRP